jgi:Cdc6-like AAA superfamily ATPase
MSQRQRLQDFFSRLPRPLRISLLLLLLASTGLTLALPLEFQSSVVGYLSALVQDWPLLVSGAIAWAFLFIARWRKWDWRWVATPAMIHGLIACGKGMRQLDEVTSGAHTVWGNAVIVALILSGLGLTLLGAWQPLLTRVAEALKRTRAEEKKARQGDWTDIEIVEAADDRFGFRDCVGVLTNRAATADTPLTIGIFGRWGSGKTSLMKLMQSKLQERADGKPAVKTLWVNVWQLSNQEELWNAFLQALLTRVHKELPFFRRLAFDWRLLRERVDRGELLRQLLINSYRIVVVVTPLLLALFWPAPLLADANQLLAVILDPWTGGGASLFLGLWLLLKPVVEAAKEKVSLDLGTVLKEAPYEAQVSALQQLQSQFERMVKAWVGKDGRLVVFIDDLDRCSPDKVPEVLEALKLFTTTHGCVYVLGLDHDVVRKGVAAKYKFSQDEGAEYLEKIVQIPFHLPPLGVHRIEAFVREDYPNVCKKCPTAPEVF